MKLKNQIKTQLEAAFKQVFVYDQRGDGHFVEVICVDPQFEGHNLVQKSRLIFAALEGLESRVHAWSVKGFTPEEWEIKAPGFELQKYEHYNRS